jgi:hypothetical protein
MNEYQFAKVAGYCPYGCGQTLHLGATGFVMCGNPGCRRPTAVAELLEDREIEHLVTLTVDRGFTVRHPLRERLGNALMTCQLHADLTGMDAMPRLPGVRYRVTPNPAAEPLPPHSAWLWEALPTTTNG